MGNYFQYEDYTPEEYGQLTPENHKDLNEYKALQDQVMEMIKHRDIRQAHPKDSKVTPEDIQDDLNKLWPRLGELRAKLESAGLHPATIAEVEERMQKFRSGRL